jgi:tetratricopeptide (TPR) repeat protein
MYRRDPSKYHQARTSFQALVDVRKSLLDAHPDLMHSKQVYAGALRDLGTAEEASGAYDLAIDNYEKSIDMLRDIIATQTHSPPRNLIVPKQNIAIHLRNLGSGYFRTGQHEKSIDAFEEAIEHLEYLQHNHSLSKQTKQRVELKLAQCNYSLGLHQMFRGRTEETFFENSLSLFSKHDSFERAFPLARLHRRDEAVQLAEEYVLNDPSVASVFWRGRLYAACAWSAKTQNQTYDFMRFRNLAIGDIEKSLVAGVSPFVVRDDPELQFLESDPLYQARISTRCVANKAATN